MFAWEAYDKGSEVHLQADPTKLELLYKSFKVKKEDFKEQQKESILEKVPPRNGFTYCIRSIKLGVQYGEPLSPMDHQEPWSCPSTKSLGTDFCFNHNPPRWSI